MELRLKPNQDWDRLCRGCSALHIMISQREQWIGLGIIGANRAYRDAVRLHPEAAYDSPLSILGERLDLDHVAFSDAPSSHVGFIHEYHHAAAEHPAIPIVKTVNRRIVLIVTPEGGKPKHRGSSDGRVLLYPWEHQKVGAACGGVPNPLAWRIGQVKAA